MKKISIFIMCGLLLSFFFSVPVDAAERHRYMKTIGDKQLDFNWQLTRGDVLTLVTGLGPEEDTTVMNRALETTSWRVYDPESKSDLLVERKGDQLVFSGLYRGEQIARKVKIDSKPWYQALSMSLRGFNRSAESKRLFWSIRPDTLDVHRLQVSRDAEETLEQSGGSSCVTERMKIQLTGFRSVFWSCNYWLRKSDGLFVRYEGPSGPPGWPMERVALVGSCSDQEGSEPTAFIDQ